jgi:hypothetical protein
VPATVPAYIVLYVSIKDSSPPGGIPLNVNIYIGFQVSSPPTGVVPTGDCTIIMLSIVLTELVQSYVVLPANAVLYKE